MLHDLGLAPEAWVDCIRGRLFAREEVELGQIPDDVALGVLYYAIVFQRGDKTFPGILEGLLVVERQLLEHCRIDFPGGLGGRLGGIGRHCRLTETDGDYQEQGHVPQFHSGFSFTLLNGQGGC